jgi:hypothetical protein
VEQWKRLRLKRKDRIIGEKEIKKKKKKSEKKKKKKKKK